MKNETLPPEGFEPFNLRNRLKTRKMKRRRRLPAHIREPIAFERLPRQKRRKIAASMHWRILSDPNGKGLFLTHDILPGSREWPKKEDEEMPPIHWADVFFMSKKPLRFGIFYNAIIRTVAMNVSEAIVKMADDYVESQIPQNNKEHKRGTYAKKLANGNTEMWFAPEPLLDSLQGLSIPGAKAKWLRDNWDNLSNLVVAKQSANILPGYARGIGLELMVNLPTIDVDTIPEAIAIFQSKGEQAFEDAPLDYQTIKNQVEPLLKVHLWRWDNAHSRAADTDPPETPDQDTLDVFQHESNAIRL